MTPKQEEQLRAMHRNCLSEWIMLSPETWEGYPQPAPQTGAAEAPPAAPPAEPQPPPS
jgi:hypothetical protein